MKRILGMHSHQVSVPHEACSISHLLSSSLSLSLPILLSSTGESFFGGETKGKDCLKLLQAEKGREE